MFIVPLQGFISLQITILHRKKVVITYLCALKESQNTNFEVNYFELLFRAILFDFEDYKMTTI